EFAGTEVVFGAVLSAAEFWKLRRDRRRRPRALDPGQSGSAHHGVHRAVFCDCSDHGGGDFFAQGSEVRSAKSAAWLWLLALPAGFAGVWRLQRTVSAEREAMRQEPDEVLVRSPRLMKLATLE